MFMLSRSDVARNVPLPFALPAVSLRYRRVTLYGAFIPKVSSNPGGNDAIVIGSGLRGLTAAAVWARQGKRVLVIERQRSFGGAAKVYSHWPLAIEASLRIG